MFVKRVDIVMRSLRSTISLTALALVLSGCAGVSQLSGQIGQRGTGQVSSQSASSSSIGAGNQSFGSSQSTISSFQSAETFSATADVRDIYGQQAVADPIDAPPPLAAVNASPNEMASTSGVTNARPMMLVPAPGQDSLPLPLEPAIQSSEIMSSQGITASSPQPAQMLSAQNAAAVQDTEMAPISTSPSVTRQQGGAVRGREFIPASLTPGQLPPSGDFLLQQQLSPEQRNVLRRFEIMQRLLSEGLITQQENDERRNANIGAVLPYTSPAPGTGLTRPVPSPDAISSRLQALKRSLEMRAITPRQHAIERGMILDAILPVRPAARAPAEPFPTNILEAARRVGTLERMRAEGVISQSEFDRERAAIDSYLMSGEIPDEDAINAVMNMPAEEAADSPAAPASNIAVHLASYRSRQAAESGWAELQSKFSSQLGGLSSVVRSVNLGGQRGTFFRLMAGPVSTQSRAQDICQELKRANQYCDTLTLDG